jgi:hypothetical protein
LPKIIWLGVDSEQDFLSSTIAALTLIFVVLRPSENDFSWKKVKENQFSAQLCQEKWFSFAQAK